MSNVFQMAKQALEMRAQMKKLQKQLEEVTSEYENAGVKIVVTGNMRVQSVTMTDEAFTDRVRLERTIRENVNKAIRIAQEKSAKAMSETTKNMGALGEIFQGLKVDD